MFHKVTLIGRVTRDVSSKFTPSGTQVTNFTLAINDSWGENKKTIWIRCTAWKKTAEIAQEYLEKGRQVHIEGRLNPDEGGNPRVYQRKNGEYASSYEVTVDKLTLLGSRNEQRQSVEEPPF